MSTTTKSGTAAVTKTASANTYTSTIISALEIDKPQIHKKLFEPFGDEGKMYFMMKKAGFDEPVSGMSYDHFEAGKTHISFQVADHDPGAAADTAIEYTLTGVVSGLDMYPRVSDVVMFPSALASNVTGVITAVDVAAKKVTVKPSPGAILPKVDSVSNNTLIITTGVSSEGSGIPAPALSRVSKFTNITQIIKETVASTGSNLTDETYFDIDGKGGMYGKALADIEYRFLTKHNGMFIHGTYDKTTVDPNNALGTTLNQSRGLLATIDTLGYSITGWDGTSVDSFDDFADIFRAEMVGSDTVIWDAMGSNVNKEVESELFTTFGAANPQPYLAENVTNKLFKGDKTFNVGSEYDFIKHHKYTYMLDVLSNWSNPETYGAKGFTFNNQGMVIPMKKTKDKKSGKLFGNIGMRHKKLGSYNRKFHLGTLAGFGTEAVGDKPVSEIDVTKTALISDIGNQFMEANSFIRYIL